MAEVRQFHVWVECPRCVGKMTVSRAGRYPLIACFNSDCPQFRKVYRFDRATAEGELLEKKEDIIAATEIINAAGK